MVLGAAEKRHGKLSGRSESKRTIIQEYQEEAVKEKKLWIT